MRIFEQKLCEVVEAMSTEKADKLVRPKLILADNSFKVISVLSLKPDDLIVCNLSSKDVKSGLSSGAWAAIERFIRLNFKWQDKVEK